MWTSELERLKTDATNQFDAEYVEHDAALGVFKSPRPSYTLDEQSRRAVWERLLLQQRQRRLESALFETQSHTASETEMSHWEDNPWQPEQRGGGIATEVEVEELSAEEVEEDSERDDKDCGSLASFDVVLVGASGEADDWEEAADDLEEDAEQTSSTTLLDMSALSGVLGEERDAWAETRREAAGASGDEGE